MPLRIVPVNDFDTASLSVSPAAATTLPVTNLQSNIRDDLWRSTSLAPQVITGTWAGNVRRLSHFSLWPSGQESSLIGATVRLQLYSDLAMSSSVYDQTWDFFTPTGPGWGDDPWGAFRWGVEYDDRTARLAPLAKWFSYVDASAFKITIANAGAVDTPYFEARRVWLGEYQDAPFNARTGMGHGWASGSEVVRNPYGPLRRKAGGTWRELRFEAVFLTESDRAKWSGIHYACDPANEVLVSLYPTAASERTRRDFTAIGSLSGLDRMTTESCDVNRLPISFLES
jgi:hypothetical protein